MRILVYLIKTHFQRPDNAPMQVVLLNVLSFLVLLLFRVILVLGGHEATYTALYRCVTLPAIWSTYLCQPWALFTHYWVHVSFFPTLWGLLLLYTLGRRIVYRLGNRHFMRLYILGGLSGGVLFLLLYNLSPHFLGTSARLSGFSGSLYAVMVASVMLSSHRSWLSPWGGELLRPQYVVGLLVLLAMANLVGNDAATNVAHLGGALLGYVYVYQWRVLGWLRQCWKEFKPKPRRPRMPSVRAKGTLQEDRAVLDLILDKVSISGYESLTPSEKQQLFNAGK